MTFPSQPAAAGELVVRNGKKRGIRLPLRNPVTVIGSAEGCDVRLSAEGINPIHCLITITPEGPFMRSWIPGATLVNGVRRTEHPLADGDGIQVGPGIFMLVWVNDPLEPPPPDDKMRAEAVQLADLFDGRMRQIADREHQLADSRALFRDERDRLSVNDAERERLHREARELHREASNERDRARRLFGKLVRRAERKWEVESDQLESERLALVQEATRLRVEEHNLSALRAGINAEAIENRDSVRDAWLAVEAQQKRMAAEWTEANDFFTKQQHILQAGERELAERETALATEKTRIERESSALHLEAVGLETRAAHARAILEEIELKRAQLGTESQSLYTLPDQVAAHQVAVDTNGQRDLLAWAADLGRGEAQLRQERYEVSKIRPGFDREAAELADRRRVLAEQFTQLAVARGKWQTAERLTITEMETLAQGLRHREKDLDAREQRILRFDSQRRQDAYDLWAIRLRLEAWQTKLTASAASFASERDRTQTDLRRRTLTLEHRESEIESRFRRWEQARALEREKLRTELELWSDDRRQLKAAAAVYDQQRRELSAELLTHAARALAAEELVASAMPDAGSTRSTRRLKVLQKRWEQLFNRHLKEIDKSRAKAADESTRLDERYRELHAALTGVIDREETLNNLTAATELAATTTHREESSADLAALNRIESTEITVLRNEIERMATVLMNAGQLDDRRSTTSEDADRDVLPFGNASRAA